MAQLVGTFVSSHAPMMAASVESAPPEQRRNFLGGVEEAARRVREQGAEAVVICSNEHFTNFFLENFPQFCVGVGASHWGPVEPWLKIDHGEIPGAPVLATRLAGQLDDVLDLPDAELELAGNGAHEIRSWLTIAGLASPSTAKVLAYEPITPWITGMGVVAYDLEPSAAGAGGAAGAGSRAAKGA